jgi:hypothetical protein
MEIKQKAVAWDKCEQFICTNSIKRGSGGMLLSDYKGDYNVEQWIMLRALCNLVNYWKAQQQWEGAVV